MGYRAYPEDGRGTRQKAYALNRLRTRRQRNWHAPNVAFNIEGPLNTDRKFPWFWVSIDPGDDGDRPEHKQIIGFEGRCDSGVVVVTWFIDGLPVDGGESHEIDSSAPSNRVDLTGIGMQPYIFENTENGGEWLRPEFDTVTDTADDVMLCCVAIFETVPV